MASLMERAVSEARLEVDASSELIVYMGCRPLQPYRGIPANHLPFHAEETPGGYRPESSLMPWPVGSLHHECPVCKDGLRDDKYMAYCCACDSVNPKTAARIDAFRDAPGRRRVGHVDIVAEKVEGAAKRVQKGRIALTESERRRLWNGNKDTRNELGIKPDQPVSNLAKAGRDFLKSINQLPDFDKILDRRGRVQGRWSLGDTPGSNELALNANDD